MNPERWARIKPIFYEAAEQPVSERAAFIRSRCDGDESLAMEIESLLGANDRAGSFIEALPTEEATIDLEDLPIQPMIGKQIGPYKVISLIGRLHRVQVPSSRAAQPQSLGFPSRRLDRARAQASTGAPIPQTGSERIRRP
jgi:hypothetical protein